MYTPPRSAAVPTAAIVRCAYLLSLCCLLFLIPLTLFVLTSHTAAAADVCPPGSDPSGCITYQHYTGRLEVRKVLRPSDNPGRFNLLIDDTILASAIGDGGTTGEQIVRAGQHSVSETTAIGTSLADYNTSVECRDADGTGSVVASQANNSPLSLMVPAGSDIVCTITNERQTGTIYVTKVVDWNGSPPNQGQTFEICVYGISYPNGSCKTVGYDGGLLTWPGVETGDYDVIETDPGSAWSVVVDSSPVTVPCGGEVSATVTNTLQSGSLEVTKTVNWNGTAPDPAKTFAICVSGPSYPVPNCQIADFDGGTLLWPNLIPGDYIVSEPDPGGDWSVTVTNSPVTVPAGSSPAQASVVNTRKLGSLEVTKTVNWNGTTPDPAKTFAICVSGPSYPVPNCQNADFDGGTLLWPNLIPGDYIVSEPDPGGGWSVTVTNSPVTVPAGSTPAQASVANTRKLGSLEVTKTVDWNGAPQDPTQSFQICITGPSYPAGNCQTVGSSGGKLLWEYLIPAPYVISEINAGSMWVVALPDGPITVPGDGKATAMVVNTHTADSLTSLKVTKTVDWNGVTPDPNQSFTICITGPSYPDGNCQNTGYLGGVLSWANLLPGAYTVSETDIGQLWTTVISGSPATIGSGNGGATASVVNTRKLGSLEVTKTVDWNGAPQDPTQSFQICITGPSYPAGNCQTVGSSGGKLLWGNLIPGPYVISETDPGSMWVVALPDGAIIVPGDGVGAQASVTNTHKLGSLEVTKVVDWIGVPVDPAQSFQICITGPSYPAGNCQIVGSNGGMLFWNNLIPGPYVVSETDPGIVWVVAVPDGPIIVPGDGKATATVLNTHKGTLDVEKFVIWNGLPEDPSQSFQVCITGPSYPEGNCQTVGSSGGHLYWYNLIPGAYVITEIDPGNMWTVEVPDGPVTVPECDCGEARAAVFNTRKLGSLEVTKTVNWNGVTPDPEQSFMICIAGPSNTDGDCKSVGADGGVLTWTDLIPGNYSVTENNPGPLWETVITGSPVAVPVDGGLASAAVINTRLVNSGTGQNPVQKPGGAFRVYLPSLGY
ncbi:MAG: hypothetical protein U0X20_16175 [Caldilineaceae bacterium]